ncbi:M20/M25/M40 family metallo-hydrolase [Winogradskyella psychrotolerans]|uniref:M20/M25/M40 family metallo-hydrolase n=1 Tax=Winogradskyella psychrotolerans TaxID=1344585 RepID=UPI001C0674F9|nr:M20/M25/M40 family metallo-hydrolase [Winogradskyella psychrotolerans]MBU2929132.1 M20/M25/M40 family metallo-hydrolase [Winogradskyella psychrotolerans]
MILKPSYKFLFFITVLCFSLLGFSQNNRKEKSIVKAVDQHTEKAIALVKKTVNINSGTMNFDGVQEVGQLYKSELDKLGFKTELTKGDTYGRAGHLIATRQGKKGPKFLMIGHLDTVFELDSPFQEYTMLNDSIMKGPGVADMKGGDVIIILAMQALNDAGLLDDMSIEIIMTGDEEKSGDPIALSKKDLIDAAKRADIALGFENGDNNPKTIVVSRRGSTDWQLKVTGNPAHSSQIFTDQIGAGAIYETSRILNEFYGQLAKEKDLTFNPGFIIGGTTLQPDEDGTGGHAFGKTNVVSQETLVRGDLRAVSLEQLIKAKATMKRIVSEHYPKTNAELTFSEGAYPPLTKTEGNVKLLGYYNTVSEDLGFGSVTAVNPRNAGAADISFTSEYVDMAIDGLGLTGGGGDHTISETGNLNTVAIQAKITAVLMYRLVNSKL